MTGPRGMPNLADSPAGYGACRRCGVSWAWAAPHVLTDTAGQTCNALCEPCHAQLSPAERLGYYRILWQQWIDGGARISWPSIEAAVLQGL